MMTISKTSSKITVVLRDFLGRVLPVSKEDIAGGGTEKVGAVGGAADGTVGGMAGGGLVGSIGYGDVVGEI